MEIAVAETQVDVRKRQPARTAQADVLRSIRSEFDRLFDRLADFGMPPLHRMFGTEPFRGWETSFGLAAPAVDMSEDEKAYTITAELPGVEAKDVEVSLSGDRLLFKGESIRRKRRRGRTST